MCHAKCLLGIRGSVCVRFCYNSIRQNVLNRGVLYTVPHMSGFTKGV